MIKSIFIENFKGFEKLKVENVTRVNLFGGENNIGKSSILEAIFAFHDRLAPDFLLKQFTWRGLIPPIQSRTEYEVWLPIFRDFDLNKEVKINIGYEDKSFKELKIKIDKEYQRPISAQEITSIQRTSPSGSDSSKQYALHLTGYSNNDRSLESFYFFTNKGLQYEKRVGKERNIPIAHYLSTRTYNPKQDSLRFGELIKNNRDHLVLEALQIIDQRITKVNPIPISENLTILHGDIGLSRQLPINYLGDGILRLLSYILAILTSPNGIILIDEIENGFYYNKQVQIWKLLFELADKYNVQILASTHSYEMIKAFNLASKELGKDYSYVELFRNKKDSIIMSNQLDRSTLEYRLENNKPFRGE
jgi:AAA15 family ATPase/GTPase